MHTITTPTFNDAYPQLIRMLKLDGHHANPRGTHTVEISPMVLQVTDPDQHIVSSRGRPINVAFAMAEVLWILAGRDDVEMLAHYNSNITQFSDNGETFNAPYGQRLRHAYGFDQIEDVIRTLTDDPYSRQAVMSIWDPIADRGWNDDGTKHKTLDRACNLMSVLNIRGGRLNWLQTQRSNDIIWGTAYNWNQFSSLQVWIAGVLGVPTGTFTHVINSLHYYYGPDAYYQGDEEVAKISYFDIYEHFPSLPYGEVGTHVLDELMRFEEIIRKDDMESGTGGMTQTLPTRYGGTHDRMAETYWYSVLRLFKAHAFYKINAYATAFHILREMGDVLGAAQIRFYCSKGWKGDTHMATKIRESFDVEVANWMLGL